jgi:hypothetical protein
MSEITIKVKQTTANRTDEIKTTKESTVLNFKEKIEEVTGMKAELQNLVYYLMIKQ